MVDGLRMDVTWSGLLGTYLCVGTFSLPGGGLILFLALVMGGFGIDLGSMREYEDSSSRVMHEVM